MLFLKNIFDFIFSFILIVILAPVLCGLWILIRLFLGSPVLFRQQRPGKDAKIFTIYKFRTMADAKDEHGNLLPDEMRITRLGKFLRSTSLDELPQLFNILKDDMSFVGPRALLVEYFPSFKVIHRWERGSYNSKKLRNVAIRSAFYYSKKWFLRGSS